MDTVTLDDIRALDREFLTPAEVGAVLGCDPQSIRVQAATDPWRLELGHAGWKPDENPPAGIY